VRREPQAADVIVSPNASFSVHTAPIGSRRCDNLANAMIRIPKYSHD
jgi:hypothetical protein